MRYEAVLESDLTTCGEVFVDVFNSPPWNESWPLSSALSRLREIAATPGFIGMKAVSDGRIVGFTLGYIESFDTGGDFYLKEMCIAPGMQRQGVGTTLLGELKSRLASAGVRKLYLLTSRDGMAARFYAKNGFYTSENMVMMGQWLKPR